MQVDLIKPDYKYIVQFKWEYEHPNLPNSLRNTWMELPEVYSSLEEAKKSVPPRKSFVYRVIQRVTVENVVA